MRLRTCIALELFLAASAVTGAGAGAFFGVDVLRDYVSLREGTALAATARPRRAEPVMPVAPTSLVIDRMSEPAPSEPAPSEPAPVEPAAPVVANVFGTADEELLAPLRAAAVTRVKVNGGGTSLSLRLDFDSGARAAFKPEQVHGHSNPRREIAAYRIDRLLGLGRVPPAIARAFELDALHAVLEGQARAVVSAEALPREGVLAGEVSWWVPVITDATIRGFRIDETDGIVTWRRLLRAGATIPDDERDLVRQISDMVLFDFVIDNLDRWTGSNAKASPDGKVLYYMDNTMSFSANPTGHSKSHIYLRRAQTFSRSLVAKLRALDAAQLRATLAVEPGSPLPFLLTDGEQQALLSRRDQALRYVDELIAEHGEAAVLAFP